MMLEEPVFWHDDVDKEKVMDYVFAHQRITKVNDAMLLQYGLSHEEFIGLTPKDFFSNDLAYGKKVWTEFFDQGRFHVNMERRKKDGSPMWVEGDYFCLYDDQGRIVGHFGIQRELTERKRLERELEETHIKLKTVLDNSDSGMIFEDKNRTIVYCNKTFCKMFNLPSPDLWIGKQCEVLMEKAKLLFADPEGFVNNILAIINNPRIVKNEELHLADGRILERSFVPIKENDLIIGYLREYKDLTDRKSLEKNLMEKTALLSSLFNSIPDPIFYKDTKGIFLGCNAPFAVLAQGNVDEIVGTTDHQVLPKEVADVCVAGDRAVLTQVKPRRTEEWIPYPGRGKALFDTLRVPLLDTDGNVTGVLGVCRDITERKRLETKFEKLSETQSILLDNIDIQVWYLKDINTYGAVNKAHADFFGLKKHQLENKNVDEFLSKKEAEVCAMGNKRVFQTKRQVHTEEWLKNANGEHRLISIVKTPKLTANNEVEYVICCGQDITERKRDELQLKYLSLHDQLTGLYNRNFFEEEMKRLQGGRDYPITVMICDVDGLKIINDTMGHEQGDKMLKICAKLLSQALRQSDVISRTGGDEFTALLAKADQTIGERIAKRIKQQVEQYNKTHQDLPLSISIGVATATNQKKSLKEALKTADELMYQEKLIQKKSSRSQIIDSLMATLAEKDYITEGHSQRLANYSTKMGKKLNLTANAITNLNLLSQVHDLGKVGIPDAILFKEGPLTQEEWSVMRQHCEKGYRIALVSPDLAGIADLILKHHEKWDGTGYPIGIKGTDIPIECRILAIVDAFDAMTSDRPYRRAKSIKEAILELKECSGTQFDPQLVELFYKTVSVVK
ncbi:sensor domain-containing diguanylate cyclase/phosphohydrolase [Desulfotomaculum sp. 1211_IL3151]|uniref:sensor domain-containing diguanylate cyclase/phosphohydrolase n=1 Tax=Desulfotomaculum sp. 1211_IL3151 TaxID=3084055 RepID=UPI002FDA446E